MEGPIVIKLELSLDVEGRDLAIRLLPPEASPTDVAASSQEGQDGGGYEEAVRRLAPRSQVELELQYLRRCVAELQADIRPPASGSRPYLNIYPPAGYRRRRLAALQLTTGRIHCELPPELGDRWPSAEVVLVNGEPDYLRIYLKTNEDVEQAVSMARTALEKRG